MTLLAAGYFACAWLGRWLSAGEGSLVTVWLPSGLSVAVLLLNRTRDWPWLMLAVLPANFAFDLLRGTPPAAIFGFYCANTLETLTGAWLVRRLVAERPALATLKEFIGLAVLAGVVSTMLGAFAGAATLKAFGLSHSFAASWKIWWGSNLMAVLLLTPFILTWWPALKERPRPAPASRKAEAVLLFLCMAGLVWYLLVCRQGVLSPNKSLLVPLLLWAGLRFGPRGATLAGLALASALFFFTSQFSLGLTAAQVASGKFLFALQTVLAMASCVALIPAIVLGERDRTTARLRESEARFRHLAAAAFEGIVISEDGRVLDTNEQMSKMFGYTREEMLGKEILDLAAPESRAALAEAIRTGRETVFGHSLRRKDGTVFYGEAQARVVEVGGRTLRMWALRDLTKQKQTEQALRESEEKFSKAFRASPDGLGISELESGRYIEVNDGYCKLYGYAREAMLGHTSVELNVWENPADRARLIEALKTAGGVRDLELRTRTRAGEIRIILLSAETIELGGKSCLVSVLHDLTEWKQAEAEREQALAREQQARVEYTLQLIAAQEAERKRIAAELHDSMGQDLLLIKNLAQMALRQPDPAAAHEQIASINQLAAQCIAEARRISRDLHPYQLDHLGLKRALEAMLENAAQASSIQFISKFEPVDELFSADAAMNLYRIVQESLNNILKHSRANRVDIRLERDVREVQLRIEDDGVGFNLEAAGAKKGLGLKNIAERVRMLGGRLCVDSSPGRGTRLDVAVPVAEKAD